MAAAPVARAADDNLLQKIKERGIMRICDVDYAPWNVKNPATNQWEGINVDLLTEVAESTITDLPRMRHLITGLARSRWRYRVVATLPL